MSDDFLKDLGFLGVTARLKRLSDTVSGSIRDLYKARGVDIEPGWHLVFLVLQERRQCTMTDLADAFRLSQPAITRMIGKMAKRGYLEVDRDQRDSRKKRIRLSRKARTRLPEFEKIWDAGQKAVRELFKSNMEFLQCLEKLEAEMEERSFEQRALNHLSWKIIERTEL
jgi:DNA-binding MarR family transcriptional regulator